MAAKVRKKPILKTRPVRTKLDPRFAYLLSMSSARLRAVNSIEQRTQERLAAERRALAVEPELRRVRREDVSKVAELKRRAFMPLTAGVHLPGVSKKPSHVFREPYASALVLFDGNSKDLTRLGARVRSYAGDVFSVFVPLSAIRRLEDSPLVRFIELSHHIRSDLDEAIPLAQIDGLHNASTPVTGKGVIVGILDSKLDFYHPDFCSGPNSSRVLFLWDQTLNAEAGENPPPTAPELPGFTPASGFTYGVEYKKEQIDAELANYNPAAPNAYRIVRHQGDPNVSAQDPLHGTHVACVAVGNGRGDAAATFKGAAPEADLIFVALEKPEPEDPMADNAALLDGFAYVFARAAQLGKPCVVNRSGSDNQGAHDGTSLGERFLDNLLLTPGRAITLAGGNSNLDNAHAAGQVTQGEDTELILRYSAPPPSSQAKNDDVVIWYDGHDRFEVTLTVPTTPPTVIGPLLPGFTTAAAAGPDVQVQVTSSLNDPRNGDNVISVFISLSNGQEIPVGDWRFRLHGTTVVNGSFEAWVDRNNRGLSAWRSFLRKDTLTLGIPATARRPITVGCHDKNTPPVIWPNSGRGTTRDGRVKPDIAATGVDVTAARLRDMNHLPNPSPLYLTPSPGGTSVSAALVAGACALLFECRGPNLSCADLKQILQTTAGTSGMTAVPDKAFGFGYLQMGDACSVAPPNVDVWLRDHVDDDGVEPFGGTVAWLSPDIEVLDANGSPAANPSHDASRRFSNIIRITVRNRGTQTARNTEVFLYWADPATSLPFPNAWNSTGIFVGNAPGFVEQGNSIVVPVLTAGSTAQVEFAWAPPAPGSNLRGDDHFCLLARLENQTDPSQIGAGGWVAITAKNNIALHNVHVQPLAAARTMRFFVEGTAETDGLRVAPVLAGGRVELRLPAHVLGWRHARFIERYGGRNGMHSREQMAKLRALTLTLEGAEIGHWVHAKGAESLELRDGIARLSLGNEAGVLWLNHLDLPNGERVAASIVATNAKINGARRYVHVGQYSGGRIAGGVSLELRPPSEFRKGTR